MLDIEPCYCYKVRYMSRREAKRAAQGLNGRGVSNKRLRPYRCPTNKRFWHLTSNPTSSVTWYRERGLS